MQTNNKILVSLCIPTNGVVEWVFPVLDSIFKQDIEIDLYEVVVTDNGHNIIFEQKIQQYCAEHHNLVYKKTSAYMFQNQIEAFKLAKGTFIKFVNHRMTLNSGALKHIIDFVKNNCDEKPVVYFLNGVLPTKKTVQTFVNFEKFVECLSYYSSWSAGLAIWADDFKRIPENQVFNLYFPHITILFHKQENCKYIIDNTQLMKEILVDDTKKGKYNLFQVFAVEYVSIIGDLLRCGSITINTFLSIKKSILLFLAELYWKHIWRKKKCSYIVDNYKLYLSVYYSMSEIFICMIKTIFKKAIKKLFGIH